MARIYKRKTGLNVISGVVKAIEPAQNGAKRVVITVSERNPQTKKWEDHDVNVTSNTVDDGVVVGAVATAAGYLWGASNIMANFVAVGPHIASVDDVEIISGLVQKAVYKDEKNDDGSPKLTRNGAPRKPHFDISVIVPDEEGHRVSHIVKIYNFSKIDDGQLSNIEKMQKRFADFKDKDSTPIECTIVTSPGQIRTWESEFKGKVYQNYCCDHMGQFSLDLNYLFDRDVPARENHPEPEVPPFATRQESQASQPSPTYGGQVPPAIEDEDVFV